MAHLEIRLLGEFELRSHGVSLPPPATLKAQSLFAYLVVHRRRLCHRERLAECFWPARPADRALHSLSTALWHIRRVLPPGEFLLADSHSVQFNAESDFWLDTAVLRSLVRVGAPDETPACETARLRKAVSLYRGDLLEHFYDDWCLEERYALEVVYLEALERLLGLYETLGQPEEALEAARRLLARDPLREDIQRAVIRLLFELDRRSEALRQARHYREVLRAELGVTPHAETVSLCASLFGPDWDRAVEGGPHTEDAPSRPGRLPLLERPPFVGREADWAELVALWRAASSGRGRFVLLSGEAGIGKSRVAEELLDYVRQHGGGAALAHCYEHERGLPYGPLVDLLRALCAEKDTMRRVPRWQAAQLAYLLPEMAELTDSEVGRRPAGLMSPPSDPQQQARLFDAVNFFLLGLAQRRPLLVIVEDLHWASDSTLAWLHSLGRRLAGVQLLLMGSCRCEETGPSHSVQKLHATLERAGLATRVELGRLELDALASWFAEGDPSFPAKLYCQTEGNPFFTLETLRVLREANLVRVTADQRLAVSATGPLPIPESVREAIRLRLARLSPGEREAAGVAAVIGRAFDLEVLERAWAGTEEATLEALDGLLRRRLIREGDPVKGSDYEFDHHLVRTIVYDDLHYRRRRRWHRAVAAALEAGPGVPGIAARIAHHLDAAAEPRRALPHYERAARDAQAQFAWQEFETHLGRVLALVDDLDPKGADPALRRRRAEILALRAEHLDNLGRVDERDADIAALEALARAGDPSVQLLALVERTRASNYGGQYRKALHLAEEGLALARREQDRTREYRFLTYVASARYFLGEPRRALRALEAAEKLLDAEEEACGHLRARLHQFLGYTHFHLAQWCESLDHHERAYECSLELKDYTRAVWNLLDTAYLKLKLGRTGEARQGMEEGLALAREMRLPAAEGYALLLLGEEALYRGAYRAAEALLEQALPLHKASRGEHNSLATRELLGWIHYHLGDLRKAREILEEAVTVGERIGHRRLWVASLMGLGLVLGVEGQVTLATDLLEEAVSVARESACVENEMKGLCALARVARQAGDIARARQHSRDALTLAQSYGIPTAEMWAWLEAGLAHLASDDPERALTDVGQAVALLPRAHAAWVRPEEVSAAHARIQRRCRASRSGRSLAS